VGLGAKELGPGLPAPWSGAQARSAQYPPDRGGRHADPELSQFALDPDTSPGSVLSTEANDEINQLVAQRRSTRTTLLPPPAPLLFGRLPVPPQQRVGSDQVGAPSRTRQQSASSFRIRGTCQSVTRTAIRMTSGGNRNPANPETGGWMGRMRRQRFIPTASFSPRSRYEPRRFHISSHSMQQCRLGQERHLLWSELGDGDFAMLGGRKLRGQGEGECGAASGGI